MDGMRDACDTLLSGPSAAAWVVDQVESPTEDFETALARLLGGERP